MAEDNHIASHMQQSAPQESQIQQTQMDLSQLQQQHLEHSQLQQNQIQQVHIQQLPIQQQQQQIQQLPIQQQQQQIQQLPIQQSQIQQQVQQTQDTTNANMSVNSTVQQADQINASSSVPFNVAAVNSQTQVQTFQQNANSSSGAPVQIAPSSVAAQLRSIQGGNMLSQASASYPIIHSTVSMAQSPLQQNIVNSSTLTGSGQVVGTAAKANFPQPIMPAPTKTIIQNRPGYSSSNQAIIGTAFINQSQPLQPMYSSVPVNSSAQVYNTNQVKQINSQPQILTAHMPGTMFNQAQIIGTLPSLPQGLTWTIPGNFQSPTVFAQNPIILPSQQQPHVFLQPSQNAVQLPAPAIPGTMSGTTLAITPNLSSRIRPSRVRPGIQTVAVATQTVASNAVTINPNAASMRTQIRPKKFLLPSFSNGFVQSVAHQVVAAQTQTNQSLPQFHPTPLLPADSVPKPVIFSKTRPLSTQSKSVEVNTRQLSQQTATESKDIASYTDEQSTAPVGVGSTISTVTASSIVMETVVNPLVTSAVMPSISVDTSSVLTTTASVVPIITSSESTVSVTPVATSSLVQENILMDTSSVVQGSDLGDVSSVTESNEVNASSLMQENLSVNSASIEKENASVSPVKLSSEALAASPMKLSSEALTASPMKLSTEEVAVSPMILSSETLATPASPSNTCLDNVTIDDSDIIGSVIEPEETKETVCNSNQSTGNESMPEKPLSHPVSVVKEKHRQRAIVKPQVLTHVIDGFVIQEGPEPFPVRQSLLRSGTSDVKSSEKHKEPEDDLSPPSEKKAKVGKPRGRPRKRRMSFRRNKGESNHLQNPSEALDNNREDANEVEKAEVVNDKTLEEVQVSVTEKAPAEETVQNKESTEEKCQVERKENVTEKLLEKWSVQEVFDFIRSLPGCEDYAQEFRSQEIDGQALMLLETHHIITFMSMKVGPALKLISQINSMKEQQMNM